MTYRIVQDGSPLELVVLGATLRELFEHAALAVFDVAFEPAQIRVERDVPVMAVGDTPDALLADWLDQVVALTRPFDLVVTTATVDRLEMGGVQGAVGGFGGAGAGSSLRGEPAGPIVQVPDGWWVRLRVCLREPPP